MKKDSKYENLVGMQILDEAEMLNLLGGGGGYGCESNVCAINRSGAADLCTRAYCRSGVGPMSPPGHPIG